MPVCRVGPDLLSHLVVRQGLGDCFLQSGRPALSSPPRLGCEAEGWTASPWAWTSLHILTPWPFLPQLVKITSEPIFFKIVIRVSSTSGWPQICYMVKDYFKPLILWAQVLGLESITTMPALCSAGDQTHSFVPTTLAASPSSSDILTLLTDSHPLLIYPLRCLFEEASSLPWHLCDLP